MHVRLTLREDLEVRAAEAVTEAGPFHSCGAIVLVFASLVGLRIGPGWRKAVLERMGGVKGCTHLTELLFGAMTATALQTVAGARARRQQATADGDPPPILDQCHALARGGAVVRQHWPEFFQESQER